MLQAQHRVITPIGLDHTEWLGDTVADIAMAKVGHHPPGRDADLRGPAGGGDASDPGALRRGRRDGRPGGQRVRRRRSGNSPSAGSCSPCRGSAGVYDEIFLPLHGEHQAQNAAVALAAVEAFLGAGVDRPLDPSRPGGFRRGHLARPAGAGADVADDPAGRRAQPARHGGDGDGARRRSSRSAGWWLVVSMLADKDASSMLELLEPVVDHVVVTRNTSPRAMSAAALGQVASEIFGEDRVRVEPAFPDAIEAAVTLAEAEGDIEPGGVGVLIIGSVVTVADARRLLRR